MYKSKEIRWFNNGSDEAILDWFASQGQSFENTEPRTDYYLPLDKDDLTVKLREGNIEIKQRIGEAAKGMLTEATEGVFEHWIKWSFNVDKADKFSLAIVSSNPHDWTETIKTRIGVKVTENANGDLQIIPIKSFVDFGCQIEYTLLQIKGKTIYTYALEWFGEKELHLPPELLSETLSHAHLDFGDSMGYGEYLRKL
jgi:hypothetical protein